MSSKLVKPGLNSEIATWSRIPKMRPVRHKVRSRLISTTTSKLTLSLTFLVRSLSFSSSLDIDLNDVGQWPYRIRRLTADSSSKIVVILRHSSSPRSIADERVPA